MDRGVWWATVHGFSKSQTRLERLSTRAYTHMWHADLRSSLWTVKLELPSGSVVKNPPANAGGTRDLGLISESKDPLGNPHQDSCLENSMDRGT